MKPFIKPFGLLALVFSLSLAAPLAVVSSCKTGGGTASQPSVVGQLVDCATAPVQAQLPNILVQVEDILKAGGSGWEQALVSLGVTYGAAVVACAVEVAIQDLGGTAPATMPTASPDQLARQGGVARGQQWLADAKVSFAEKH